jgi:hypothetical protein
MPGAESGHLFPYPKEKVPEMEHLGLQPFDYQASRRFYNNLSPENAYRTRIFARPKNYQRHEPAEGRLIKVITSRKGLKLGNEQMVGVVIAQKKADHLSDTADNIDLNSETEEYLLAKDYDFFYSMPGSGTTNNEL